MAQLVLYIRWISIISDHFPSLFSLKCPLSMVALSFSGYTIYMQLHYKKMLNSTGAGLNCFISTIIDVALHSGFPAHGSKQQPNLLVLFYSLVLALVEPLNWSPRVASSNYFPSLTLAISPNVNEIYT